ncbi:ABC transporter permease [Curtobacterium sp. MCSS17_011]|uniref:ABC transporter permease n=1 Tax=Curtobacterium sp. MCSS17_011 TaxID=2175643 RepID=UPI000D8CFDB6|nr:ABC transporter permease [Curtobacterium sp. MCSS17_011]PYY62634.1 ABC transporter permease [Curtobacterium sp. MCSS17_011]
MRPTLAVGRRLGGLVIVFLGVTFLIYAMTFALPGDPIKALGGERPLTDTVVRTLRAEYHLDQPLWLQYVEYLGGLFRGDFGTDFNGQSVGEQMASRWPVTITLALSAWALEIVLGIGLGVLSALKRGTVLDKTVLVGTIVVGAVPVFVLGVALQLVFSVRLHWFPVAGVTAGWPTAYVLPAFVIALFGLAAVSRLTRTSMIETLDADYVRTARAKGLAPGRIVGVHVLRNSLIPTATYLATDLGYLMGGTVIIEGIFNLPGVGNLLFQGIRSHEGAVVVGISTALILVFLVTSVLVDLLHAALDPRVRTGASR